MISKKRRITRTSFPIHRKDMGRYFRSGEFLSMTHYFDDSIQNSRFTVILSKKNEKYASKRNRLKRMIYEAVRQKEKQFDMILRGYIVFVLKKTQKIPDFSEIERDIESFLGK